MTCKQCGLKKKSSELERTLVALEQYRRRLKGVQATATGISQDARKISRAAAAPPEMRRLAKEIEKDASALATYTGRVAVKGHALRQIKHDRGGYRG